MKMRYPYAFIHIDAPKMFYFHAAKIQFTVIKTWTQMIALERLVATRYL